MRDVLGPGTILGYCTNVHAGATLEQTKANLEKFALAVKARVSPNAPMGVGLWFSARAARELRTDRDTLQRFKDWLEESGLLAFTLNGFPYGDFHRKVVKYDVYQPDWSTTERVEYTLDLIHVLDFLLQAGAEGSISTLPLGWRTSRLEGWEDRFDEVLDELGKLYAETGRLIHLDVEPEPGCLIEDETGDLGEYRFLHHEDDYESFDRHFRLCLDVCHCATMFASSVSVLERARYGGLRIGKVQISSAISASFAGLSSEQKRAVRSDLMRFIEPRYLHQTVVGPGHYGPKAFYDDLPEALSTRGHHEEEWRIHFHVPVYLERIGRLATTQQEVMAFLKAIRPEDEIHHFEVETYAWDVLPPELRVDDLAEGIARELQWVIDNFDPRTRGKTP